MISTRTPLLQIQTTAGWQYVCCWSMTSGQVLTTANYKKGIRAEHRACFEAHAGDSLFRVITAEEVAHAARCLVAA